MKTIVMTGGTSGLGKVAVQRMMESPNARVLLGARRNGPPGVETLELELTRLDWRIPNRILTVISRPALLAGALTHHRSSATCSRLGPWLRILRRNVINSPFSLTIRDQLPARGSCATLV